MADVTLTIDGQPVTVPAGTTLLKAAAQLGTAIPTICYHEHCTANGLCRMCVVEVEGQRLLQPACLVPAAEGLRVQTRSERVARSRRTIGEMLAASVDLSQAPELQAQLADYGADPERFPEAERRARPVIDDNPMYVRDYAKCILCWRCVQVCAEDAQYTFALSFDGRGYNTQIGTFFEKPLPETACVFCGQCVGVCPTNALKPKREWLLEQGQTPDEIMAQTRSGRRRKRG
ncbi:MAG: (2Fe-2S)-binding protein [Anaerolineales bacterium]|nr:(2Fe-2S)-binding protein [Anaerolineales bacterium]